MKTILFPFLLATLFAASCTITSGSKTTTRTFNGGELIYTDSFTDSQANALGEYLVESGFYNGKPVSVSLSKQEGMIHLAMYIKDNYLNSADYQKLSEAFIDEIEQKVFKGSIVAMDFCDEQMNVKKTIKAAPKAMADVTPAADIETPETVETADNPNPIIGYWICNNITGGDLTSTEKQLKDLKVLKTNFTFEFNDGGSFGSQFANQADVENPIEKTGAYTVTNNRIVFDDLTINSKVSKQQMKFDIALTDDQLQLTSKEPGKKDLIMTFERTQ